MAQPPEDLAYWFTTAANKTKAIVGSGKSSDTTVTDAAHIGYWNDNEVHYYLKMVLMKLMMPADISTKNWKTESAIL